MPIALARSNFGQHRAEIRRVRGRAGLPAQAVVHGVEMVADIAGVRHRPDQAKVLGQLGQAWVQFADAHAGDRRGNRLVRPADFRRRCRLEVPGVEVAGPAAQQDEDARLLGSAAATRLIAIDARRHHAGNAQIQQAQAAGLEKATARDRGRRLLLLAV